MQSENTGSVQHNDQYCTNCNARKAWVEIVLVDELNRPVAGIPYTLAVSGGETRTGISGPDGLIREESLPLTSVILKTDAQKLTDEMENRPLREGRGAEHSDVKKLAARNNHGYRYAVIGELCDRAPDIENWNKEAFGLPRYHFKSETETDARILCSGSIVGGNTHRLRLQHHLSPAGRQPEYSFFCYCTG